MKKALFAALLIGLAATTAQAQKPPADKPAQTSYDSNRVSPSSDITMTPEMWFYEQERRRSEDPATIVRANAEQRAAERHTRLAAMAWFGLSNSRPQCSPDPVHGNYSPRWSSNGYYPSQWIGAGSGIIYEADRGASHY